MNGPRTTREALIAEALGDLGRLIDQAQALIPAMNEARQAVIVAHDRLLQQAADQRSTFELQIGKLSEKAKTQVVTHIVARADEACRRTVQKQTSEMRDALRALLAAEIDLAMQRLAVPLRLLKERKSGAYDLWLTHLAAAATASALTWVLMPWLVARW